MKTINYTGSSKLISRIVNLLNRKAPLPLDGGGDPDWGTNGQVLSTDGSGNTAWVNQGGGDSVSWTQDVTTGTKIASIDINGNSTDVYAPSGGSGGHTIEDSAGTSMTQRTGLQFVGADVTDDSANNRTVVTAQRVYLGNLTSLGSGTPANTAISYFENNIPNNTVAIAYNSLGNEYTIIFSRGGSVNNGTILKYGQGQKDVYILRKAGGTWQSADWEKIDAGYAATAGSATSATNDGNGNAIDSTYLKKAGDDVNGKLSLYPQATPCLKFRSASPTWCSFLTAYNGGNEAVVFATKNAVTSWMFVNGEDSEATTDVNRWMYLVPGLQVKNNCVAIGKLIGSGVTPTYTLDVGGTINASSTITQNGTAVMLKSDVEVIPLTLSATTSWQTYTGSTTNVVKACAVNVTNNANQYNFFYSCGHIGAREFQLHYRCADGNQTMNCEVIIFS